MFELVLRSRTRAETSSQTHVCFRAAIKTKSSKRLDELAQPAVRQVGSNLPKENAFDVSKAAQRARCSDRLTELAQPVIRGAS